MLIDLFAAAAASAAGVLTGAGLWGLHLGLSGGLLAALVSLTSPAPLRGTAFGLFAVVSGIMLLAGSMIAGLLWDAIGPQATFLAGAAFSALTLTGMLLTRRWWRGPGSA